VLEKLLSHVEFLRERNYSQWIGIRDEEKAVQITKVDGIV